jgi:hypothetical protein
LAVIKQQKIKKKTAENLEPLLGQRQTKKVADRTWKIHMVSELRLLIFGTVWTAICVAAIYFHLADFEDSH